MSKLDELKKGWGGHDPKKVIEALKGETLVSVGLKDDKIHLKTTTHSVVFSSEGDCCTHTYYTDLEVCGLPAQINSIEFKDWKSKDDGEYGDVQETQFITIKTSKGFVDFTLHADHNGYYGGWVRIDKVERL